ncbi:MAG: NRDE family protein [Chitinophagaceae bacterium]|nr:NRDE family protein [Chitinophagaceae bacterium]
MCTVTFIPADGRAFITHSRDEKSVRPAALPPQLHELSNCRVLYPKDGAAGGSWIAMNDHGNAAVLLNGAFKKHLPLPPYRKSRGLSFLEIMAAGDIIKGYQSADLNGIEPFTVILYNGEELLECRWDAMKKHITKLNPQEPHIWSSVTLYDPKAIEKRRSWFRGWLQSGSVQSADEIVSFHLTGGDGDKSNDICMNREGLLLTVSVTGMEIAAGAGTMTYIDLINNGKYKEEIEFARTSLQTI